MKGYKIILIIGIIISVINDGKSQIVKSRTPSTPIVNCKCNYLSPVIEIWNHTGTDFIIGNWGNKKDSYIKSNGWDSSNFPYPKTFDMKLIIVNNQILYGRSTKIGEFKLSVNLKLKVGQNEDALYPLNSRIVENIQLIKDKPIVDKNFKRGANSINHIDVWRKNINFSALYLKYKKRGLFINQLIFEINLIAGNNYNCNYEYAFLMAERSEP